MAARNRLRAFSVHLPVMVAWPPMSAASAPRLANAGRSTGDLHVDGDGFDEFADVSGQGVDGERWEDGGALAGGG
jgi:hypothetical protein